MHQTITSRTRPFSLILVLLLIGALLPLASVQAAQPAHLVKDINTTPLALDQTEELLQVAIGTVRYFVTSTASQGSELWRSDGTSAGTYIVKEIAPGSDNANILSFVTTNGLVFFSTATSVWRSDGTETGTIPLKVSASLVSRLEVVGSNVFFTISRRVGSPSLTEVWKSDGSISGTSQVYDFTQPVNQANGALQLGSVQQAQTQETLFYFNGTNGLWRSDGTRAGTLQLANVYKETGIQFGNQFIFKADIAQGLWTSDGTPQGTRQFANNHQLINPVVFDDAVYFLDTGAKELWRTDGTAAGTKRVQQFVSISSLAQSDTPAILGDITPQIAPPFIYTIAGPIVVGQKLFIGTMYNGEDTLWISDGTSEGIQSIANVAFTSGVAINGIFYFKRQGNLSVQRPAELWRSDGTTAGTFFLHSLPGETVSPLIAVNGLIMMTLITGTQKEVWRSDGTSAGTFSIHVIEQNRGDSDPAMLIGINGRLIFATNDVTSVSLWSSDGSEANTTRLSQVPTTPSIGLFRSPSELLGGTAFLPFGSDLWKSDGTAAGTSVVPNTPQYSFQPVVSGNTVFFVGQDDTHGVELWKTDGTAGGTSLVKDIYPGTDGSNTSSLVDVNGTLFFSTYHPTNSGLWKSDGTEAGTSFVASTPMLLGANVNGTLFFHEGNQLWKSDGTPEGTVLVKAGPNFQYLTVVGTQLMMLGTDSEHGTELWTSNGTEAGTTIVADINPGPLSSISIGVPPSPQLSVISDTLIFAASDGVHGNEPWRSDGTAAGTSMIADIAPLTANSNPSSLTLSGANLFFAADDATTGRELWALPLAAGPALDVTLPAVIPLPANHISTVAIPYTNIGDQALTSVSLTAVLDPALSYVDDDAATPPNVNETTVTWQLPGVGFLATNQLRVQLQLPESSPGTRYPLELTFTGQTANGQTVTVVQNVEIVAAYQTLLPIIRR